MIDEQAVSTLFTPFSIGPKNCIGRNFAKMEIRLFVGNFLKRYKVEDIAGQSSERTNLLTLKLLYGEYRVKVTRNE